MEPRLLSDKTLNDIREKWRLEFGNLDVLNLLDHIAAQQEIIARLLKGLEPFASLRIITEADDHDRSMRWLYLYADDIRNARALVEETRKGEPR